ncbi:MAG: hypothetical protein AB8G05_07335 [Oligoflexales bacterium]
MQALRLTYLLSLLTSLSLQEAGDYAYAHGKSQTRFVKKLQSASQNRSIKQCQYVGNNNYFSMIALESSKNKSLSPVEQTNLLLFTNKGKFLKKFQLAAKESSFFDRQSNAFEKIHYTVSKDRRLLAVCKNISKKNSLEIEIWNMHKNQRINIFRLDRHSCNSAPIFDSSITKVAYININGKLSIWNIANGIRVPIPEPIRNLNCLSLSQDFNLAYCYKHETLMSAYMLDDSKSALIINHPETMYPNSLTGYILKSLNSLKFRIPNFLYSLGMDRPQFSSMQTKINELVYFYRTPNTRRSGHKQEYEGMLIRSQLDSGKLLETHPYEEPYDIRLANVKYSGKSLLLIGEDRTIDKENYKAFFAVSFTDDRKHRFGVECAHDWELIPGTDHIITCGFCENKNKIKIWDVLPKKS